MLEKLAIQIDVHNIVSRHSYPVCDIYASRRDFSIQLGGKYYTYMLVRRHRYPVCDIYASRRDLSIQLGGKYYTYMLVRRHSYPVLRHIYTSRRESSIQKGDIAIQFCCIYTSRRYIRLNKFTPHSRPN